MGCCRLLDSFSSASKNWRKSYHQNRTRMNSRMQRIHNKVTSTCTSCMVQLSKARYVYAGTSVNTPCRRKFAAHAGFMTGHMMGTLSLRTKRPLCGEKSPRRFQNCTCHTKACDNTKSKATSFYLVRNLCVVVLWRPSPTRPSQNTIRKGFRFC